jgi:subtilisin family serine protease
MITRLKSGRPLALFRIRRVAVVAFFLAALVQISHGMDLVRVESQTDAAVAKYGVSGSGVTVAVLDRGIDWRNPDFIRPDGTTRIKWILDMSGQNLCDPSNPPPAEYTEAQINAALAGGPPIGERDAVGHGTATAGVAAGNGSAFADGRYRGIAPQADLIVVKVTSEGAPAHDGEPPESPFQGCIDQALDWLDGKMTQLGQPAVAIINSGTQWGPVDGTSAVSRKIDQVFGANTPGRVFIAPAGDEGGLNNHAGGTYDDTGDTVVGTMKSTTDTSYLQMWYTGGTPANVTVTFADGTVVGPVGPGQFLDQNGIFIIQYQPGSEFYPWTSSSGDRAVWIRMIGHSGAGSIRISALQGAGAFDVYGDVSGPNLTSILSFSDHLVPGHLTDYAATHSAIVVADYVVRTSYVDIDGISRDLSNEGAVGDLWYRSSDGPTRDGRTPPVDLAASGQNLFTSSAQNSYWHSLRFNLNQEGGGWYVRFGGTSGSAPIVVGAVALMLQMQPTLTADQARQVLQSTAVSDSFTGMTPNPSWGYGKLNVLAALDALNQ